MLRHDAVICCGRGMVAVGFPSQHEARLRIAALKFQVWCSKWGKSGRCIALDVEPVVFALEEQRSKGGGSLDAVDLRAGDVCHGAGRDQLGGIDAQLRTIGERHRLCISDLVMWRY